MKGDAEAVRNLTVMLERDGDGYKGKFEIAATSL
jgi:hypothetical protein